MRVPVLPYAKVLLPVCSLLLSGVACSTANKNSLSSAPAASDSFLSSSLARLQHGHAVLQLGGYWSAAGKSQHIDIAGLIGDDFTLDNHTSSNGLVGLGYYVDGQDINPLNMSYGINAFYLPKTGVSGTVVQEGYFSNLAYSYSLRHFPLYAIAKSRINLSSPRYALTVDAGIGPNFMNTDSFQERSLDGITLPDVIFSGKSRTVFSATAGAGIKLNQVFGNAPLECGYRFFYLGKGAFNTLNNQVLTQLTTGTAYANAVMCSITV